jgi:hypothetical protein
MTDIISDLNVLWATAYGASLDTSASSPDGQIIGGVAEMFSDLEGNGYDIYQGLSNPNGSTGQMLTNIAALNNVTRNGGMPSSVPVTFTGAPGTVIPTGTLLQNTRADGTTAQWSQIYTLSGGTKTPGAVVSGGGATSGVWGICTVNGATQCLTTDTMKALSVITGMTGVTVDSAATTGYVSEGDPNIRIRRQQSFGMAAQGMADALDSALNNMPTDVVQAAVWENNTSLPRSFAGGGTLNPNSIRVIVAMQGAGVAQHVVDNIYAMKPPGCGMQGGTTGTATDEQGNSHIITYDLGTPIAVHVRVPITTRAGWPSDGQAQIANAIAAWGATPQNTPLGGNSAGVVSWKEVLGSFLGVPGFDFADTGMQLGTVSGGSISWLASGSSLPIAFNQYAQFLSTNVTFAIYG